MPREWDRQSIQGRIEASFAGQPRGAEAQLLPEIESRVRGGPRLITFDSLFLTILDPDVSKKFALTAMLTLVSLAEAVERSDRAGEALNLHLEEFLFLVGFGSDNSLEASQVVPIKLDKQRRSPVSIDQMEIGSGFSAFLVVHSHPPRR